MPKIRVVPLGAGQDVGRSCILVSIGGKNVMLDCGMHMGFSDERRFPNFSYIIDGNITDYIDCVIISHFHLDHCGALPYMTEMIGYDGKIFMTYPTKAICPVLLEDFRKIQTDYRGEKDFFTSNHIKKCMAKVIPVNLHEEIWVDDELSIQAFYAGHVLGAAMFLIRVGSESVLYTGDFNMTPDRHLGPARVPAGLKPDLLITETTYATTIRDSKRARERSFLKKIHDTVINGGKVLIPVFALGRAQELCILLESYWERLDLKIPIYFSQGLAGRATEYYRMFINWTNEKIKKTFVERNMFDFRHIKGFDPQLADTPGPMILFSTPGMLHGGQSLRVFKKWCGNDQNLIVMPGYCAVGTIGAKVVAGQKRIEIEGKMYDIKIRVDYMSFSAHADAKGIKQLIHDVQPRHLMFVHGEDGKMETLKAQVEKEFNLPVFKPANGETVSIPTNHDLLVEVPEELIDRAMKNCPDPSKTRCPLDAYLLLNKETKTMEVISTEKAAELLGVQLHSISMSEIFVIDEPIVDWNAVGERLRILDPDVQVKLDGLDLFNSELLVLETPGQSHRIEMIWDECREHWVDVLLRLIPARPMQLERAQQ